MVGSRGVAGHLLLVGAEVAGNPVRLVLAALRAAEAEASVATDEGLVPQQTKSTCVGGLGKVTGEILEARMSLKHGRSGLTIRLLLLAFFIALAACNSNKTEKPSVQLFGSPEDAGNALLAAAKSGDENTIVGLFGPESKDVIYSGDPVQDKNAASAFVTRYSTMHRWRTMSNGSQTLVVGADNFPFPIPLKKNATGQWFFDTAAGKNEVLSRRIGGNELAVIDICGAVGDAQAEYFASPHDGQPANQYAAKFLSDPGKQNGLYWKPAEGQPASPLGPLMASATAEGYSQTSEAHAPFHGYYFHMLKGQTSKTPSGAKEYMNNGKMTGGFAFVGYPAQYGNSGVMTFMMSQDGVLLEKDLGKTTAETATSMSEFDPDPSWNIVGQ
jgi:hypothetical protein